MNPEPTLVATRTCTCGLVTLIKTRLWLWPSKSEAQLVLADRLESRCCAMGCARDKSTITITTEGEAE